MLDTVRKTYDLMGRERRARWVLVVIGALIATGFEMVGALLVFLLLALIADPGSELDIPLVGNLRAQFQGADETTFLLGVAAILGVFFLIRVVVQLSFTYIKFRLVHNAAARLAATLAEGYLRLPYAFHLRRNSAELVRNAHQTVESLAGQTFLPVIQIMADGLVVFGLLAVMLFIAPVGTGIAVLIVGTAAVLLLRIVQPRLKRLGAEAQEMRKRTLTLLQESLHGIRDIKVLGAEAYFGKYYARYRRMLARTLYLRGVIGDAPKHVVETALIGFILVMFAISVAIGTTTERLLSTLGVLAYAGLRIMPALQKVVAGLNSIKFAGPAVDQVHDDWVAVTAASRVGAADLARPEGVVRLTEEIRLEDVSFSYDETDHPAIETVDLTIDAGQAVGVCGPTGGGKTTLVDLITGLLAPSTGAITVDGRDIREFRSGWFAQLGVVPQMVFLTDDSLRRNIALGVEEDQIDDEAIWEAIHLAQLEEFVNSLPDGLETHVGERGVRISGGQRQRVAVARALYRRPSVLIFDEGTSALDTVTERALLSSLARLRGEHTILMVAHRLTTVRTCDVVVYLDDGRIQGKGDFEQLRSGNEGFRALAENM